ncbi:MAG: hypothetical protein AB1716_24770 [Planctomycetota bacterium]
MKVVCRGFEAGSNGRCAVCGGAVPRGRFGVCQRTAACRREYDRRWRRGGPLAPAARLTPLAVFADPALRGLLRADAPRFTIVAPYEQFALAVGRAMPELAMLAALRTAKRLYYVALYLTWCEWRRRDIERERAERQAQAAEDRRAGIRRRRRRKVDADLSADTWAKHHQALGVRISGRQVREWLGRIRRDGWQSLARDQRGRPAGSGRHLPVEFEREVAKCRSRGETLAAIWRGMRGEWSACVTPWIGLRSFQSRFRQGPRLARGGQKGGGQE